MPYNRRYRRRVVRKNQRKRKRWYFDARIGKNVPIIGGTGVRLGTRNMVRRIARSEIAKQEEVKQQYQQWLTSDAVTPVDYRFLDNTIYTFSPPQMISNGVLADQRVGDQIYYKHLLTRLSISTSAPSMHIRMVVLWSEADMATLTTSNPRVLPGLGQADLFYPTNSGLVDALWNNKLEHSVVCERKFVFINPNPGQYVAKTYTVDCAINSKVTYKSNNNRLFKDKQLYVILICDIPEVASGTNLSNPKVAQFNIAFLNTYRDS